MNSFTMAVVSYLSERPSKEVTDLFDKVKNAKGALTYKVTGAAKSRKVLKLNKKTGKVTVKKGLKKGTYEIRVKVTAAGNAIYDKVTKTVTFKIKVK